MREWLLEKVVKMLASRDNVAEKYAKADEKEEKESKKGKGGNQEEDDGPERSDWWLKEREGERNGDRLFLKF